MTDAMTASARPPSTAHDAAAERPDASLPAEPNTAMPARATSHRVTEGPAHGFFALDLLDNRFPQLHGMRVLAVVSVVAYHVTWLFMGEQGILLDLQFFAQSLTLFFGMDLFFVLSGFLIGSILLNSVASSGALGLRRFYLRRVFRTFPSYYVVLTVLALAFPLTSFQRHHLAWEYVYGANFLQLLHQTVMYWGWSLDVEEQFYLFVPLLFMVLQRLRSNRARIVFLSALWTLALAIRLVIYLRYRPWNDLALYGALYFRTYTRFDTLVAGVLLALVHRSYGKAVARWLQAPFHRALVALPCLACLWLLLAPAMFGFENVQLVHVFAWGSVTSLMYLGLVPLGIYGEGWVCAWLSQPIFRRLGTLGYGVYLVHIPIINHVLVPMARAAQQRHWSMLIVWPAAVAGALILSLALAYALHLVVEKPSLRLRERLAA